MAEIMSKPLCQVCEYEQALGMFRNKWICGKCLIKFENKIKAQNSKVLDIIESEIKKEVNYSDNR